MIQSAGWELEFVMRNAAVYGNPDAFLHAAKVSKIFPDLSAKGKSVGTEFQKQTGIIQHHFDEFIRIYHASQNNSHLVEEFAFDLSLTPLRNAGFFGNTPLTESEKNNQKTRWKKYGQIVMDGCCRNIEMLDCFVEMGVTITMDHYERLNSLDNQDPVKSEIRRHLLQNPENAPAVNELTRLHQSWQEFDKKCAAACKVA